MYAALCVQVPRKTGRQSCALLIFVPYQDTLEISRGPEHDVLLVEVYDWNQFTANELLGSQAALHEFPLTVVLEWPALVRAKVKVPSEH